MDWRRFSLSPSQGERAGVRGLFLSDVQGSTRENSGFGEFFPQGEGNQSPHWLRSRPPRMALPPHEPPFANGLAMIPPLPFPRGEGRGEGSLSVGRSELLLSSGARFGIICPIYG